MWNCRTWSAPRAVLVPRAAPLAEHRRGLPAVLEGGRRRQDREHVELAEAVDPQSDPGAQRHGGVDVAGHHRVEDDVLGREVVEHGAHQPHGVRDGDLAALVGVVELAPGAVAADVDPAERRVGGVPVPDRAHQPLPRGEEDLVVPVGDVGAGLARQPGRGGVEPAAGTPRHHAEAEAAVELVGAGQALVEPGEVVDAGRRLDALPRDLVAVVDVADGPGLRLRGRAEPLVLAAHRVRDLGRGQRDGPERSTTVRRLRGAVSRPRRRGGPHARVPESSLPDRLGRARAGQLGRVAAGRPGQRREGARPRHGGRPSEHALIGGRPVQT